MPLVSIITPSWNVARLIGETIESVQAQTLTDWELLIADDCSTDETAAVVESYASNDPRIQADPSAAQWRPGARPPGRHRAGAEAALSPSSTATISGCPAKLERQIAFRRRTPLAPQFYGLPPHQRVRLGHRPADRGAGSLSYGQLLKNTSIATLTALVDRDIAGPIAMKNEPYDDFCLWLSILKPGQVAHGLNEDLARYRVRGASVSSRPLRSAGWVWHIYRNVEHLLAAQSAWCFAHWGARAWLKRRQF